MGRNGSDEINSLHGDEGQYDEDEVEHEQDEMESMLHLQLDECKTNFEGAVVEGENANEQLDVMESISSFVKTPSPPAASSCPSPAESPGPSPAPSPAAGSPGVVLDSSSSSTSATASSSTSSSYDDSVAGYSASSDCRSAGNQSTTWVLGTFGIMKPSR